MIKIVVKKLIEKPMNGTEWHDRNEKNEWFEKFLRNLQRNHIFVQNLVIWKVFFRCMLNSY